MTITIRPADIEAEITFLTSAQGGRKSSAISGYRPNHDFGLDGMLNDASHEYINTQVVALGQTVMANMWFLVAQYQAGRLHPGFRFTVQEGSRVVGHGVITQVFNAELQRSV